MVIFSDEQVKAALGYDKLVDALSEVFVLIIKCH